MPRRETDSGRPACPRQPQRGLGGRRESGFHNAGTHVDDPHRAIGGQPRDGLQRDDQARRIHSKVVRRPLPCPGESEDSPRQDPALLIDPDDADPVVGDRADDPRDDRPGPSCPPAGPQLHGTSSECCGGGQQDTSAHRPCRRTPAMSGKRNRAGSKSGLQYSTPRSSTATVTSGLPVVNSHAGSRLMSIPGTPTCVQHHPLEFGR